ncbi:alpha-E domain-containing protein [bacterium]|nr:alpha-E domain-containing protein [bacterium]
MISRLAEHCFWLSRYIERAENIARLLEVNQNWLLDFDIPVDLQWKPLLIISGIHDYKGNYDKESVLGFMTWDSENPFSIVSSMTQARENARVIREIISAEMWERLNYNYLWLQSNTAKDLYENNKYELYNQIKRINQLLQGIGESTMLRTEAWEFYQFGRHLERSSQTARILDVKYHMLQSNPAISGTNIEISYWTSLLKSCSGYEPFLKHAKIIENQVGNAVAEFLILEETFPRSIRYCLKECLNSVMSISQKSKSKTSNTTLEALRHLIGWISTDDTRQLIGVKLHSILTHIVDNVHAVSDSLTRTYFDFKPEDHELEMSTI